MVHAEDLDAALAALGRACDSEVENPFAWMRQGQVAERLWDREGGPAEVLIRARESYRKLVELRPLSLNNHILFIGASSKLGELAQAEALYRHWASERPDVAVFAQARDAAAAELKLRGSGGLLTGREETAPPESGDSFKLYLLLGSISLVLALLLLALWAWERKAGQAGVSNLLLGLLFAGGGALGLGTALAKRTRSTTL